MLHLNGIETSLKEGYPTYPQGIPLLEFLENHSFRLSHIAVELNMEILPREDYGQTILHDGDELEVVQFMGGGSC